jgi:hypothetical protein
LQMFSINSEYFSIEIQSQLETSESI